MATELSGIRRAIRNPGSRGMALHVTGVGHKPTLANIAGIMAASPRGVIMMGFCGAADPGLRTGDLHVADYFHSVDVAQSGPVAADPALSADLTAAARQSAARVVTEPSATVGAVAGAVVKAAVRASTGAASVNMEDYWAAKAARAAGVPFASVRAVLDTADAELPAWLSDPSDSAARVAWGLAGHPGRAAALLRLARQARVARRNLTLTMLTAIEMMTAPHSALTAVAP